MSSTDLSGTDPFTAVPGNFSGTLFPLWDSDIGSVKLVNLLTYALVHLLYEFILIFSAVHINT